MRDVITESDLELISMLQLAPRISWKDAAEVLETNPVSLATRWERLRSRGLAWVTAHPGSQRDDLLLTYVELDCESSAVSSVVEKLCRNPRVVTIELSARGRDLLLTVQTPDFDELTSFVIDEVAKIHGVQRYRTHLVTAIHFQGSEWRIPALSKAQVQRIKELAPTRSVDLSIQPPDDSWPLVHALGMDGRMSAAAIARHTGRNPATVRRQLARLLASGLLTFRCDIAQGQSAWPISCTYIANIPQARLDETVAALKTLPELRLCASTTGSTNLMVTVWTVRINDLIRIERLFAQMLPWMTISDSNVTLRTVKRMGWMLDSLGRATGDLVVPTTYRR